MAERLNVAVILYTEKRKSVAVIVQFARGESGTVPKENRRCAKAEAVTKCTYTHNPTKLCRAAAQVPRVAGDRTRASGGGRAVGVCSASRSISRRSRSRFVERVSTPKGFRFHAVSSTFQRKTHNLSAINSASTHESMCGCDLRLLVSNTSASQWPRTSSPFVFAATKSSPGVGDLRNALFDTRKETTLLVLLTDDPLCPSLG
ncbi:uncharacterized protein FOMMEDRAFT_157120 [Fomitiporia mediterranea MF3/22]|uniref:uncharacterized protein n=1 Tax=Fomitiporia mediterranea (strain MF3/22) TaxID=694068 RepID=UPI0004407EF0|nr:uncharacterized protein FOMMEDRAFT_157120 [Fomitiporia mediterranea MF3/22]EJD01978.1 hypothetical protein FOMMEDRAFT_157120 [Fomitiporia mediterranea MF3/22]